MKRRGHLEMLLSRNSVSRDVWTFPEVEVLFGGDLQREHTATRMFDQQDLIGAQQLLADDQGADRIPSVSSCVANDMSITQSDPKRCCRVDPGIHASHWDRSSLFL